MSRPVAPERPRPVSRPATAVALLRLRELTLRRVARRPLCRGRAQSRLRVRQDERRDRDVPDRSGVRRRRPRPWRGRLDPAHGAAAERRPGHRGGVDELAAGHPGLRDVAGAGGRRRARDQQDQLALGAAPAGRAHALRHGARAARARACSPTRRSAPTPRCGAGSMPTATARRPEWPRTRGRHRAARYETSEPNP